MGFLGGTYFSLDLVQVEGGGRFLNLKLTILPFFYLKKKLINQAHGGTMIFIFEGSHLLLGILFINFDPFFWSSVVGDNCP